MRSLLLVAVLAAVGPAAFAEDECPVIDPSQSMVFHRFPPEAKSLTQAQFQPEGTGQEGIDRIVDLIVRSLREGCTPIRLVTVHGTADFDSRGTAFEDHVSVERAYRATKELMAALGPAQVAAVERGEARKIKVWFSFGGQGTRLPTHPHPADEAERSENRMVSVTFAAGSESAEVPVGAVAPEAVEQTSENSE